MLIQTPQAALPINVQTSQSGRLTQIGQRQIQVCRGNFRYTQVNFRYNHVHWELVTQKSIQLQSGIVMYTRRSVKFRYTKIHKKLGTLYTRAQVHWDIYTAICTLLEHIAPGPDNLEVSGK